MCTCLYRLTCESATSRCIRMRSSTFCSSSLRMSSFRFVPRCTSRLSCAMHDTATHWWDHTFEHRFQPMTTTTTTTTSSSSSNGAKSTIGLAAEANRGHTHRPPARH